MKIFIISSIFLVNFLIWKYLLNSVFIKINNLNSIFIYVLVFIVLHLFPYLVCLGIANRYWGSYDIVTNPLVVMFSVYTTFYIYKHLIREK